MEQKNILNNKNDELQLLGNIKMNTNILQLHFVKQLYESSLKYEDQILTKKNQFQKNVNLYRYDLLTNQVIPNKQLLLKFMNIPYLTSLNVLENLLKQSSIQNVDKLIKSQQKTTIYNNQQKKYRIIDPIAFFLINTDLITQKNSQSISLSLWIMMDIWIKYLQTKIEDSNNSQTLNQINKCSPINISNFNDTRKIYSINRDQYGLVSNPSQIDEKSRKLTKKQFQNEYKRPLMYLISIWLLKLSNQTTMLKYFIIQNDLLKQLINGDYLATLIVQNKYIFAEDFQQNHQITYNQSQSLKYRQALLIKKLQNVVNLQDLLIIQKQLQQIEREIAQNKLQQNNINQKTLLMTPDQYVLPWMGLITTKNVLLQLLTKKNGFDLALKILQRRPKTFQKIYGDSILTNLFMEFDQILKAKHSNNQSNTYRRKGNPNIKLKKQIYYSNIKKEQNEQKKQNKYLNKRQRKQIENMKKIVEFYKKNSKQSGMKMVNAKFLEAINQI